MHLDTGSAQRCARHAESAPPRLLGPSHARGRTRRSSAMCTSTSGSTPQHALRDRLARNVGRPLHLSVIATVARPTRTVKLETRQRRSCAWRLRRRMIGVEVTHFRHWPAVLATLPLVCRHARTTASSSIRRQPPRACRGSRLDARTRTGTGSARRPAPGCR